MCAYSALGRVRAIIRAAACGTLLIAPPAIAGLSDSGLEFSSDEVKLDFNVKDTPRHEVLKLLFDGSPIEIKWISASFAAHRIGGKFSGTRADVLRQLLVGTNFVTVHQDENDVSRVVRLIIVGPSNGELSSAGLTALAASIKTANQRDAFRPEAVEIGLLAPHPQPSQLTPQLTDGGPAAPTTVPVRDLSLARDVLLSRKVSNADATGVLVPPPEGATAPNLVPEPGAEASLLQSQPRTFQSIPQSFHSDIPDSR
jgi:hypothetical protein